MSGIRVEKPGLHVSVPDWISRNWEIRQYAGTSGSDSFEHRFDSAQLRNETEVKCNWMCHHSNVRLSDRITEMKNVLKKLEDCQERVNQEIELLRQEKKNTDIDKNKFSSRIALATDCLRIRDKRILQDRCRDEPMLQLKNELQVCENWFSDLKKKSKTAWEQTNKLKERLSHLGRDIEDKKGCLEIEMEVLMIDKNSANLSRVPDVNRTDKMSIPYELWIERSNMNLVATDNEVYTSTKLRETMLAARNRASDEYESQMSSTDAALRRRYFDTEQTKMELEYQRNSTMKELEKLLQEIRDCENAAADKVPVIKIPQPRMEMKHLRPLSELVVDESYIGLTRKLDEAKICKRLLDAKANDLRFCNTRMESLLARLDDDLERKNQTLQIETECMELRGRDIIKTRTDQMERNMAMYNTKEANPE